MQPTYRPTLSLPNSNGANATAYFWLPENTGGAHPPSVPTRPWPDFNGAGFPSLYLGPLRPGGSEDLRAIIR